MNTERKSADFHVHYNPDKISRHNETHPGTLDAETETTIEKIIASNIKYVGIVGRTVVGTPKIIDLIRSRLEVHGIKVIFGMEYHAVLPPDLRRLTLRGFVDFICFGFDHSSPEIQKEFGSDPTNSTELNARIAKEFLEKLTRLGFNLEPQTEEQKETLKNLKEGRIANKADHLSLLILDLADQNKDIIGDLEKKYGPPNEIDKRNNGYSSQKNWLYRLLFQAPTGLASFYFQKQPDVLTNLIHQTGGVVLYSPEGKFDPKVMDYLLSLGIDGVMGWHGAELEDLPIPVVKSLRKSGKLVLGGSDFDPVKDSWQPGMGKGTMYLSDRRGKELVNYLNAHSGGTHKTSSNP